VVAKAWAVIVLACMLVPLAWSSRAWADCSAGILPERVSCLNQQLETERTQSSREIAGLKADVQMLRNQLLSLKATLDAFPPAANIARLDEDLNMLWEPQDGCLAWTGSDAGTKRRRIAAGLCPLHQRSGQEQRLVAVAPGADQSGALKGGRENEKPRPRGVGGTGEGRGFNAGRLRNAYSHRTPSCCC